MPKIHAMLLCAMLLTASLYAADNTTNFHGWEVTAGLNYRGFDEVELQRFDFTPGKYNFISGSIQKLPFNNYKYTVKNPSQQVHFDGQPTKNNLTLIQYHSAVMQDTHEDLNGAPGVSLRATKEINDFQTFTLKLAFSLNTAFESNDISTVPQQLGLTQFDLQSNSWPTTTPPTRPDPDTTSITVKTSNPYVLSQIQQPLAQPSALVQYDYDLDMYTAGAGLAAERSTGPLRFTLGGGPAISLISYRINRTASAAWRSSGNTFFARRDDTDEGLDVYAGMYARIGLDWQATQNMTVGLSGRYDWIPENVDTDYADFELSGFSGTVSVGWSF